MGSQNITFLELPGSVAPVHMQCRKHCLHGATDGVVADVSSWIDFIPNHISTGKELMDHCRDMFYGKVVDYIKAAATLSDKCSKPFRVYVFVADPGSVCPDIFYSGTIASVHSDVTIPSPVLIRCHARLRKLCIEFIVSRLRKEFTELGLFSMPKSIVRIYTPTQIRSWDHTPDKAMKTAKAYIDSSPWMNQHHIDDINWMPGDGNCAIAIYRAWIRQHLGKAANIVTPYISASFDV